MKTTTKTPRYAIGELHMTVFSTRSWFSKSDIKSTSHLKNNNNNFVFGLFGSLLHVGRKYVLGMVVPLRSVRLQCLRPECLGRVVELAPTRPHHSDHPARTWILLQPPPRTPPITGVTASNSRKTETCRDKVQVFRASVTLCRDEHSFVASFLLFVGRG